MRRTYNDLEPQEIFSDSSVRDGGGMSHVEGKLERPLPYSAFSSVLILGGLVALIYSAQALYLGVFNHEYYRTRADQNRLSSTVVIAERGSVEDRNGKPLAKNVSTTSADGTLVVTREYSLGEAAAHLVGYVSYPKRDSSGNLYQTRIEGLAGVEQLYDEALAGVNGMQIMETDATGSSTSGKIIKSPTPGPALKLSIDAELQQEMYDRIKARVDEAYIGGAAAIMDVHTGELLSLVSYPSFSPTVMSLGYPQSKVSAYMSDSRGPFVDRAVVGLYAPGSIVKPFIAASALQEKIVTPEKTFYSSGKLVVPNPYDPDKPGIFRDWKAHGTVDMRRAIAVSSDVYFYIIGGGFEGQKGLGITAINEDVSKFGFGKRTGFPDDAEPEGIVPNPEWKKENFDNDDWRLGDTFISSIGQFGWQVTLLQSLRATAALANDGALLAPSILASSTASSTQIGFSSSAMQVAREGMRNAVTEGTAQALSMPEVRIAAKTGTAEVGERKEYTNSLIIGFFPYDEPKYAFALILERSKAGTQIGAPAVMSEIMRWMVKNKPQYVTPQSKLTAKSSEVQ